jgi:hypothetical protein
MLAQTATSRNATRHPDFFICAKLTKTPLEAKKTMRMGAKTDLVDVLFHEWSFL